MIAFDFTDGSVKGGESAYQAEARGFPTPDRVLAAHNYRSRGPAEDYTKRRDLCITPDVLYARGDSLTDANTCI